MNLQEWNYVQVYLFRKYKIDPHNFRLVFNIASCIGQYREEEFSLNLVEEIDIIVEKLIKFLGKEK